MGVTINIAAPSGDRVETSVSGYERPPSSNPQDDNWLTCVVTISVGGFQGRTDATMQTHDFALFSTALDGMLDAYEKVATFNSLEETLEMRLEADSFGHVTVSGTVTNGDGTTTLTFTFQTDQSYLRTTQRELHALLAEFPIR